MQPQDSQDSKSTVSLFDVIPDFLLTAGTSEYQGILIRVKVVSIGPDIAAQLLKTQCQNRKPSDVRISEYARRITSGEWMLGEPWVFDESGQMIDAQHRAHAVVKSGQSVTAIILQGIPSENQSVMDLGMNRRIVDIAKLQGVVISSNQVSIARAMVLPWGEAASASAPLHSPAYFLRYHAAHRDAIAAASRCYGSMPYQYSPVRGMVATAWDHENHEALESFLQVFDTMIAATEIEHSIVRLRHEIQKTKGMGGGSRRKEFALKACSVLKAYLQGRAIKVIKQSACPWPHPAKKVEAMQQSKTPAC